MTESEFLEIATQYLDFDNPLKWRMHFDRRAENFRAIAKQEFFKVIIYGRIRDGVESWCASIDCDRLILVETKKEFSISLKDTFEELRSRWRTFLQNASLFKSEETELDLECAKFLEATGIRRSE